MASNQSSTKSPGNHTAKTPPSSPAGKPPVKAALPGATHLLTPAGVCVSLIALVWFVFGQTLRHEFVNLDDNIYVYDFPTVAHGLSWEGVVWAFTHVHAGNWHPLTTISHMLDCSIYGLSPGGHHATNVLLHGAAVVLLFLLLRRWTGALWRSAFVAAIFAIHPLRVESVAWVAERKDLLSGVFFLLTAGAYARFASGGSRKQTWYAASLVLFALGLLCKPMLVTMPFVLLLLDYWPLQRFSPACGPAWSSTLRKCILEKIPFLLLSFADCGATLVAQKLAIQPLEILPLAVRLENALVSYVTYLAELVWPVNLTVLYPFSGAETLATQGWLSGNLLLAVSASAIVLRRKYPALFVGWFWYLGMLVPVIGVIQVGFQAHADRYTYLPHIGILLLVTWTAEGWARPQPWRRSLLVCVACTTVLIAAVLGRAQTTCWRDKESLWTHVLHCTSGNYIAENSLGITLLEKGRISEALPHLMNAIKINPTYVTGLGNLGNALVDAGKVEEGLSFLNRALKVSANDAVVLSGIGNALRKKGDLQNAIVFCRRALAADPAYGGGCYNLGQALIENGQIDEAIACFSKAVELSPKLMLAQLSLANALCVTGRADHAIEHYRCVLTLAPGDLATENNLAWILATFPDAAARDGKQALLLAQDAVAKSRSASNLSTLSAAYAETGDFSSAIEVARNALETPDSQMNPSVRETLTEQIRVYRSGGKFRDQTLQKSTTAK